MKRFLFTVLCVLFLSGCGDDSRPKDLPALYPCSLTITQEGGKPLDGATVELKPLDGGTRYNPLQFTDANGVAVMTTYTFNGVPAGKYKVLVTKNIEEETTTTDKNTGEPVVVGGAKYRYVEKIYSDVQTTPLEIEITGKEKKVVQTFDVGKAIKEGRF
ncbi:MAG: carboxypeptidase-like regulatory domain-containing protein [Planctomycetaceae bacterium]|jgi:hypothetical protein|nr:carboxypeptidase-like regulatory domain-containing protein [Planctomycetaceae bacterium]